MAIEHHSLDSKARAKRQNESVFLRACRNEKTDSVPVWLMRQAGRYMKEYRVIREKTNFLSLCKDKDLCAEITVFAQEKINADAAIIFSDLLVIVEPFGLQLEYVKHGGPQISNPISSVEDVSRMTNPETTSSLSFVYDAIRETRKRLKADVPLIGFAGCPFTLASYMIEGGASKNFKKTKCFMYNEAEAWHTLLSKIVIATKEYLFCQVEAGADALQLFDSWVGSLSPSDYREFVFPHSRTLFESLKETNVPVIHFGTGTAPFFSDFKNAGGDVIGIDYHIDIARADVILGPEVAIQGNLDPLVLFSPLPVLKRKTQEILDQVKDRPGYIFNLGHGILPETPVDHVIALIEMVHEARG